LRRQQRSIHKIQKQLRRELNHQDWLEKNLTKSKTQRNSKRKILILRTELAIKNAE
jgi:hypothetical protein